jgi:CheY-like chemotaxis protein
MAGQSGVVVARIAVVDDSKLVRVFVAAALEKAGHEVLLIEPDSLQETLDALVAGKPELLLLDLSMPAFQGPSLVRACFEHPDLAKLKVLILTAFHDAAVAERMEKLGVAAILHKPILHEDLTSAVERLLAAPPKVE